VLFGLVGSIHQNLKLCVEFCSLSFAQFFFSKLNGTKSKLNDTSYEINDTIARTCTARLKTAAASEVSFLKLKSILNTLKVKNTNNALNTNKNNTHHIQVQLSY